ncbi:hypothetical protein LXL04_027721 [Taraxacum kok-saghyz]
MIFSETSTEFKAVGESRTRDEGSSLFSLRISISELPESRVSVRASEDIVCTRLEPQREETKGPHSSISESLFQISVTEKWEFGSFQWLHIEDMDEDDSNGNENEVNIMRSLGNVLWFVSCIAIV